MTKRYARLLTVISLFSLSMAMAGCAFAAPSDDNDNIAQQLIEKAEPAGNWVLPGGGYGLQRYSALDKINTENVANLEVAYTLSTGTFRGHEGQPLVVGDMMYFVTPWPNIVYAIDLNDGNKLAWQFIPPTDEQAKGVACCDVVNRGVFYADGKIYMAALDGMVYALDAETGDVIWKQDNADASKGEAITTAPLVAEGNVIVGMSGGEYGVHGYSTAYDMDTGELVWRFYNTGPDDIVGIEDGTYDPYFDWMAADNLGAATWPEERWKNGGASSWGWMSYDPELGLFYYGTSNPSPWNAAMRRANDEKILDQKAYANLFSVSIMARDAKTGKLVWAYSMTPHDEWDYDGSNEMILLEMKIDGEMRDVLVTFNRNGFVYVLDRATGELLSAEKYGAVNWAKKIDLETGLPVRNPEKGWTKGVMTENICPSLFGVKNRQPAAYSPDTGLFYVPTANWCMDRKGIAVKYVAGVPYIGSKMKITHGPGDYLGALKAWDVETGEPKWVIHDNWPFWGGILATGGNLIFFGTLDGWFKAANATTGEVLWKFHTSSGIVGNPIAYTGPDGKQYIAILSGLGGTSGVITALGLHPTDPFGVFGLANTKLTELYKSTTKGGALYIFALDDITGS